MATRHGQALRVGLLACWGICAGCGEKDKADSPSRTTEPEAVRSEASEQASAEEAEKAATTSAASDPTAAPANVAAPPESAERTDSGLASRRLSEGTGTEHPTALSPVRVHYSGWTTDGNLFDSSYRRQRPATFPLDGVIAGWTEGLQLMVVGERRRFWIPEALAYQGRPNAPAGMLVFDVELLEILPAIPAAPEDVSAPPAGATKTSSGLAHQRLSAGSGSDHPAATSRVRVNYAGWTTDGKRFDSSYQRAQPAEFPLNGVIAGWTEGLQLMVVGEKRRFWIPEELAYQGRPGKPPGMLVFDVELLAIL